MKYKIKLTPLDWYFLGGETTFGEGDRRNYYAQSNLLPQESALLGMLRFELLKANRQIPITDNSTAIKLVGEKGFSYENGINDNDTIYGLIKSISPLFIEKDSELLYKISGCYNQQLRFESGIASLEFSLEKEKRIPKIENFTCKNLLPEQWGSLSGKMYKELDENNPSTCIFRKKTKIGITKVQAERFDDNQDGFFKTELCCLNPGFSFVFYANIDDESFKGIKHVFLGAERSMFSMEVTEDTIETSFEKQILNAYSTISELNEIFFIGDAFVPQDALTLCEFAWIETIPFKNISRAVAKGKNYASLSKHEKSQRFNLIKRGGVLFFLDNNKDELLKFIENNYFKKSGYNHFIVKTTNKK